VKVKIVQISPVGINIRAWIWTENSAKGFELKCDLYEAIYRRFQEEHISFSKIIPTISGSREIVKETLT